MIEAKEDNLYHWIKIERDFDLALLELECLALDEDDLAGVKSWIFREDFSCFLLWVRKYGTSRLLGKLFSQCRNA